MKQRPELVIIRPTATPYCYLNGERIRSDFTSGTFSSIDTTRFGKDETPELYKVKEQLTDDGPFSIYLVYNEFSEAEVYEKELS